MVRTKSVPILTDEEVDLEARIISAAGSVGPRNVAEISRLTGAHPETIRYKIKRQFASQGFGFGACVDYDKLGLALHWGRFDMSPMYCQSASRFFRSLNHIAYLVHYSKIVPQGHFIALFSLPNGTSNKFAELFESMKQHKVISGYSFDQVLAQRHKSMDPTFYDFRKGRWAVDWERVKTVPSIPLAADERKSQVLADKIDMLIIKELQKDPRQHIVEIARKLEMNSKTLEYHYRNHVVKENLIPSFMVRWVTDSNEPFGRSTVTVRLTFKDLEGRQYKTVQSFMYKLPFLWLEDLLEHGTYAATLVIPQADFNPTMVYIGDELQFLMRNAEMGLLNTDESFNYTIPYHMFAEGRWRFDVKKMQKAILNEINSGLEK